VRNELSRYTTLWKALKNREFVEIFKVSLIRFY